MCFHATPPPAAYGRRFRALTGILRSPIWQKQRCTQDIPLLQCCVERTLVVQDVKAFMDLKHQENSEKTSIASVIASHKAHIASYKAHLATLEANTASTLERMGVAAASMQSHQAPGEQPWPQQSPSLDASTICCTAVVDENECRCRGGR